MRYDFMLGILNTHESNCDIIFNIFFYRSSSSLLFLNLCGMAAKGIRFSLPELCPIDEGAVVLPSQQLSDDGVAAAAV